MATSSIMLTCGTIVGSYTVEERQKCEESSLIRTKRECERVAGLNTGPFKNVMMRSLRIVSNSSRPMLSNHGMQCILLLLIYYIVFVGSTGAEVAANDTRNSARRHEQEEQLHAKVEDIAIFVLSNTDHEGLMARDRVIGSARTWMRMFANVFVVLEDTFQVRYAMRHCSMAEYNRYTTFKCHHEPYYLMAHNCSRAPHTPDERRDCKLDESLDYLLNSERNLLTTTRYALFTADNMYVRPDQLVRWLSAVDRSGVPQYPIIASADRKLSRRRGLLGVKGCTEIRTRNYALPFVMNRALLSRMHSAAKNNAVQELTHRLGVAYDTAVGVLAWMLSANHMLIPSVNENEMHKGALAFSPSDMFLYHVQRAHTERCDDGKDSKWLATQRYVQNVVIGCGDVGRPAPRHFPLDGANMYDTWEYFKKHGKDIVLDTAGVNGYIESHVLVDPQHSVRHVLHESETNAWAGLYEWHTYFTNHAFLFNGTRHRIARDETLTSRVLPRLIPLEGYRGTSHSLTHDITKEWKAFSLEDCSSPGLRSA